MHEPQEGKDMDRRDTVRERFEALEQQTEPLQYETQALKAHTYTVERQLRWWRLLWGVAALGFALLAVPRLVQAKTFSCGAGDVSCLIDAIHEANANGEANTIRLAAGTYTLTAVDNDTEGPNGLPSVTSTLTLQGAGADTTVIERASSTTLFRLLHVATTGELTLEGLTVSGGNVGFSDFGGGLFNRGVLALEHTTVSHNVADGGGGLFNGGGVVTIARSTIRENDAGHPGGGIYVEGGVVTILRSTLADNFADGGGALLLSFFGSPSTVVITESAIVDNRSFVQEGGGLAVGSRGVLVATNTTIARNSGGADPGGGVASFGTSILTNCTVTENSVNGFGGGVSGAVALQNTIVALNTGFGGESADCLGPVTSLGNNLIGDPIGFFARCTITLQPTDRTGDPGLATFRDNGRPGNGHFPLLKTSQAIDAGNKAECPRTDQLGRLRLGPCDIGAIEFRHRDNRQHDEEDEHHDKDLAAAAPASQ
jgi:hypothetical protein